ncbi:MAG TPA: acyl-CoA dehydrogenase family protein, partial [Kofleriaceae bacterium]
MDRTLFTEEHIAFRQAFRQFMEREVVPNQPRWREAGQVDRELWRKAGAQGFLCPWLEESYGGAGSDFIASTVVIEELAKHYESGFAMALHSDIV